jgi:hypothetical protein
MAVFLAFVLKQELAPYKLGWKLIASVLWWCCCL